MRASSPNPNMFLAYLGLKTKKSPSQIKNEIASRKNISEKTRSLLQANVEHITTEIIRNYLEELSIGHFEHHSIEEIKIMLKLKNFESRIDDSIVELFKSSRNSAELHYIFRKVEAMTEDDFNNDTDVEVTDVFEIPNAKRERRSTSTKSTQNEKTISIREKNISQSVQKEIAKDLKRSKRRYPSGTSSPEPNPTSMRGKPPTLQNLNNTLPKSTHVKDRKTGKRKRNEIFSSSSSSTDNDEPAYNKEPVDKDELPTKDIGIQVPSAKKSRPFKRDFFDQFYTSGVTEAIAKEHLPIHIKLSYLNDGMDLITEKLEQIAPTRKFPNKASTSKIKKNG